MQSLDIKGGGAMPVLGFGTWQLRDKEAVAATRMALDIGYRHIDTAQIYENEAEVGTALAESKVAREKIFLTTKIWMNNFTAARVASSTEESLRKLKTDYVDLLLIHWPSADVPLSETLGAMQKLLDAGRTRAIGVSNFPVAEMKKAVGEVGAPIACNQVEYHAMLSQKPVLDYARKQGIAVTAYSPLGRGKLSDNLVLVRIGKKYGKSPEQVALRWLIQQPGVAAIPKAASEKHARSNFEIFDFTLDEGDRKAIDALGGDNRLINPEWAPRWDAA